MSTPLPRCRPTMRIKWDREHKAVSPGSAILLGINQAAVAAGGRGEVGGGRSKQVHWSGKAALEPSPKHENTLPHSQAFHFRPSFCWSSAQAFSFEVLSRNIIYFYSHLAMETHCSSPLHSYPPSPQLLTLISRSPIPGRIYSSKVWLILIAFRGPSPNSPSYLQLWVPFNKGSTNAQRELPVFASETGSLIFQASWGFPGFTDKWTLVTRWLCQRCFCFLSRQPWATLRHCQWSGQCLLFRLSRLC